MSTTITCAGIDDTAAVQAAVSAGGVVVLEGPSCKLTAPLLMGAVQNTGILAACDIVSTANPIVRMHGSRLAIQGYGVPVSMWGPGVGIDFISGGGLVLDLLSINTGGNGIWLKSGAGAYITRVNLNGGQGNGSYPLRVETWDTLRASIFTSEEHDGGIRMANCSNIQLTDIILDRLGQQYGVGLQIEATGQVSNVQTLNFWMSAGQHPIVLAGYPGVITNVMMENTYATGFAHHNVEIYGNVTGFKPGVNMVL